MGEGLLTCAQSLASRFSQSPLVLALLRSRSPGLRWPDVRELRSFQSEVGQEPYERSQHLTPGISRLAVTPAVGRCPKGVQLTRLSRLRNRGRRWEWDSRRW